jgi:glycosyltransferase involved in cell wall biosynthesis
MSTQSGQFEVSVVIPFYNEDDNVKPLFDVLFPVLDRMQLVFEVITVNDRSCDDTEARLRQIAEQDSRVTVLHLVRNSGQTAALQAGFDHTRGEVVVPLDANLQNDPRDIPNLLAKLDEGYGVVSGWRKTVRMPRRASCRAGSPTR